MKQNLVQERRKTSRIPGSDPVQVALHMDPKTFAEFQKIVYERSGISLQKGKENLVSARVNKRVRALKLVDHRAYLHFLLNGAPESEFVELIDAISTNVTHFFRESDHFDSMLDSMRTWLGDGQTRFRIWSSACSTGEEPYTMAIALNEAFDDRLGNVKILASDISTKVLEACREGAYDEHKLDGLSPEQLRRYFDKVGDRPSTWVAKSVLKRMLVCKRINLSAPPFPLTGPLDVIFCRNVMIYFDNTVRENLINDFHRLLKPGGMLMVGHAESLSGIRHPFKTVRPTVYIKD